MREQKNTFYLNLAKNIKSNPKIFWKLVNNKRKTKDFVQDLKYVNADGSEGWVYDDAGKDNVLGRSFVSVYIANFS